MDYKQARKEHLLLLKQQLGSVKAVADLGDADPNYISSIISKRGTRNLGDDVAERIEKKLGLLQGTLDQPPGASPSYTNVEPYEASETELLRAQLIAEFDRLPIASQQALVTRAQQIGEAIDALPDFIRESLSPPREADKYTAWEAKLLKEVQKRPPISTTPTKHKSKGEQ